MTAAVEAMGRAVVSLDALKTAAALPPEMQALNSLLEAQALVKKRQVSRQQSAQGGPGNNNRNYDVSALFDKELQRLQETQVRNTSALRRSEPREPRRPRENRGAGAPAGRDAQAAAGPRPPAPGRRRDGAAAREADPRAGRAAAAGRGAGAPDVEARVGPAEHGGVADRVLVWKRADRAAAARHLERHAQRHERSAPPRLGAGRGRRQPGPREAEVPRTAAPWRERGPAEEARRSPA